MAVTHFILMIVFISALTFDSATAAKKNKPASRIISLACEIDGDCLASEYCNYNISSDYGLCGQCRTSDNVGCDAVLQEICVDGVCLVL
jgi:hypothetical protein